MKKDFSNIDQALEAVEDIAFLENMISNNYNDVISTGEYSYATFVRRVDNFVDSLAKDVGTPSRMPIYLKMLLSNSMDCEDASFWQKQADLEAEKLGRELAGKKLLAYGSGAAFEHYGKYFKNSIFSGIIVDSEYLAQKPVSHVGPPLM